MLILAGVSLNATIGDNGIITRAQLASLESKIAKYKEELETNLVADVVDGKINDRRNVTLLNEYVRKYIPSLQEEDVGKFGIIEGELYYLGNDELGKRAAKQQLLAVIPDGKSLDEFIADIEDSAIDSVVKSLAGSAFTTTDENGNSVEVGIQLLDKNMQNAHWKIINEVNNGKNVATYGTGWTYVEEGTELEGLGKLTQGYIINYEDRKAVRFDGNKHSMLSWDSGLAVSKGLIFTVDPKIIESGFNGDKSWADGIEVYGYKEDYSDTFTKTSIKFDGENDYIIVPGNTGDIIKNGFTYEFYGKFNGNGRWLSDITDEISKYENNPEKVPKEQNHVYINTVKNNDNRTYQVYENKNSGILSYGLKKFDTSVTTDLRFLIKNNVRNTNLPENHLGVITFFYGNGDLLREPVLNEDGEVVYNPDGSIQTTIYKNEKFYNEFIGKEVETGNTMTPWSAYKWIVSDVDYYHQSFEFLSHGLDYAYGDELYYSIVVDPINDKQSIYINGELIESVPLNSRAWKYTEQNIGEQNNGYWFVGKSTESPAQYWNMFEGDIYTTRIYERTLTSEEIKANYNATISYHNFMLNGGNAETGGNTGGDDF